MLDTAPPKKVCQLCNLELEIVAFGKDRARADGLNSRCKVCINARASERRERCRRGLPQLDHRCRNGIPKLSRRAPLKPRGLPEGTEIDRVGLLVLAALDHGHGLTQREIVAEVLEYSDPKCRSAPDQFRDRIGEALGELFAARLIATCGEAERRIYYRRRIA